MNTPTAALAWELWRRHRVRLMIVFGVLLGFILVYPKLCALAGINPGGTDVTDQLASRIGPFDGQPTLLRVFRILCLGFLSGGPAVTMVITLLYVIWMFTITSVDQKTKDSMVFRVRLFTLPVSTSFLFWRFVLGGLAAVFVLSRIWVYCVPLPRIEPFMVFENCFGWMTLLVVTQGIVWSLAAWPQTRMLTLMTVLFFFLGSPVRRDIVESPFVLPPLFLAGTLLARAGLEKMRSGQWQGWNWKWPFARLAELTEWRGPKRFASPAHAQLWFEWRRTLGRMCLFTFALVLVPIVCLLIRAAAGYAPLGNEAMSALTAYLAGVPLLIYWSSALEPGRTDLAFLFLRPLNNGAMVMARLKASMIAAVLSSGAVLVGMVALPLLGNFHAVEQSISPYLAYRVAFVIGFTFLVWRVAVINLCFVLTGNKWAAGMPMLILYAFMAGAALFLGPLQDSVRSGWILYVVEALLVVKFLLALLAFRASLKRRLLASSACVRYLAVWGLLVAALLATMLILAPPPREETLLVSLLIVLLMPLARIGFSPISLEWSRHS